MFRHGALARCASQHSWPASAPHSCTARGMYIAAPADAIKVPSVMHSKYPGHRARSHLQAPIAGGRARRIPDVYQWTPDMLVALMAERKRRLGLVIDLTFSDKYYDADKAFKPHHVAYVKLKSRGHGEVPAPATVNAFFWAVRKFTVQFQAEWQRARSFQLPASHCINPEYICLRWAHQSMWEIEAFAPSTNRRFTMLCGSDQQKRYLHGQCRPAWHSTLSRCLRSWYGTHLIF